jgi:hypothetical protein
MGMRRLVPLLLVLACTPESPEPTNSSSPASPEPAPEPRPTEPDAPTEPAAITVALEPATEPERHRVVWQRTKPRENEWVRSSLMAADPVGARAWVYRGPHMHDGEHEEPYAREYLAELLEIDVDASREQTVLRGVVGKSNADTHEQYGELWPLVDRPEDLVVLGELVAAGHAVARVLVDPERERLHHWNEMGHVRASDRRGAPLELTPLDIAALQFGADASHRAYFTCDTPIMACERGTKGVFVERDGNVQRVAGLDWVDEIHWSPTLNAFFASTRDIVGDHACVYRIAPDGSEAVRLICVGEGEDDTDGVGVRFAPNVRRAIIGSFLDVDELVRRHVWLDLERGAVEAIAVVPHTRQVHCLFDDGLALALASGLDTKQDTESHFGLAMFAPNSARGGLLRGNITSVACERFADDSVIAMREDDDGRFSLIQVELSKRSRSR